MPIGAVCCGSKGYCDEGQTCGTTGCLGGSSVDSDPDPGTTGYTCSEEVLGDACSVQFCLNVDSCEAYYRIDGKVFQCSSCQSITGCAERGADYCAGDGDSGFSSPVGSSSSSGSSSSEDDGGCAIGHGRNPASSGTLLFVLAAIGGGWARRRRHNVSARKQ